MADNEAHIETALRLVKAGLSPEAVTEGFLAEHPGASTSDLVAAIRTAAARIQAQADELNRQRADRLKGMRPSNDNPET